MKSRVPSLLLLVFLLPLGLVFGCSSATDASNDHPDTGAGAHDDTKPSTNDSAAADSHPSGAGTTSDAGVKKDASGGHEDAGRGHEDASRGHEDASRGHHVDGAVVPDTTAQPDSAGRVDSASQFPRPSAPGQLVITEYMVVPVPPAAPNEEWFEIHNPGNTTYNLNGCTIGDGAPTNPELVIINTDLLVAPGAFLVASRVAGPESGNTIAFSPGLVYGNGLVLDDQIDEIILTCGGVVVDQVTWNSAGTGFAPPPGESAQLGACLFSQGNLATVNDTGTNWCEDPGMPGSEQGTQYYAQPNTGTPGRANVNCGGGANGGQTACP